MLDFIPGAWACIFGNFSCLPWQILRSQLTPDALEGKLSLIRKRLHRPVLVTTDRLRRKFVEGHEGTFDNIVVVDQDQTTDDGSSFPHLDTLIASTEDIGRPAAFLIPTSGTTSEQKLAIADFPTSLSRLKRLEKHLVSRKGIMFSPFDAVAGTALVAQPGPERSSCSLRGSRRSPANCFRWSRSFVSRA